MKKIISRINRFLKDNNLKPIRTAKLRNGLVCRFYKNGNIRTNDWVHINNNNKK